MFDSYASINLSLLLPTEVKLQKVYVSPISTPKNPNRGVNEHFQVKLAQQ